MFVCSLTFYETSQTILLRHDSVYLHQTLSAWQMPITTATTLGQTGTIWSYRATCSAVVDCWRSHLRRSPSNPDGVDVQTSRRPLLGLPRIQFCMSVATELLQTRWSSFAKLSVLAMASARECGNHVLPLLSSLNSGSL